MKKKLRPKRVKLRPLSRCIADVDKIVSEYVRRKTPYCVTCFTKDDLTCSHLIRRGKQAVRFDLLNCGVQCKRCNYRHEFYPEIYTRWFLFQYGQEAYDKLVERSLPLKKWTRAELSAIIETFSKLKESKEGL